MSIQRRFIATSVALFVSAGISLAQEIETLFYTVDNEQCFKSFEANIGSIDIVGPQCYKMDEFGTMWGTVDKQIVDLAKKQNVKVMPLVLNAGFDQPSFLRLLHDSVALGRAVKSMVNVCNANGFYGIQKDFLWPLIVTNRTDMRTVEVGIANFSNLYTTDWPHQIAAAVVVMLPIVIVFLLAQKYFVKGITMTGLKG